LSRFFLQEKNGRPSAPLSSTGKNNRSTHGALRALDPLTGQIRWEFKYVSAPWAGVLSTAGGLVFSGDMEGYFIAFDARFGKELWHFGTGAPVYTSPITYALDGKQYIVITSGGALFNFPLVQ